MHHVKISIISHLMLHSAQGHVLGKEPSNKPDEPAAEANNTASGEGQAQEQVITLIRVQGCQKLGKPRFVWNF